MQLERLKTIAKSDDRILRLHILYLRKQISSTQCHLTITNLIQLKGEKLKQVFLESVAIYLNIGTDELFSNRLHIDTEYDLEHLIEDLIKNEINLLIPDEKFSWLNSIRSYYLVTSIINAMCKTRNFELLNNDITQHQILKKVKGKRIDNEDSTYKKNNLHILDDFDPTNRDLLFSNFEPLQANKDDHIYEKIIIQFDYLVLDRRENFRTSLVLLDELKNHYFKVIDSIPLKYNVFKIKNENLINSTYQRLVKRYNIIDFLGSAETIEAKNQTIQTTIDLLYLTLDEENYTKEIKHITDKLSLDKSKANDFSISLNERHWKMLVELAGGKSDAKIRKTINALINDAHKKNS
ncbi:hypothetical protein [Vibrio parahaemolyticus]|uniref:hypothetical protein n=1 Tax=Vibrio parahaemolyticus TaxID=670 RepID=UPI00215B9963|nr:hypothetical protein [Vibrio parahaemolyticus]MCR9863834.1 hypothetical protein [Vibrio parahaemolyticus]